MITVIGLGFVGLTTALGFAQKGLKVYGIDISEEKLQAIKSGKIPFYEPGLPEALEKYSGKQFIATNNLAEALADSEIVFFCVGTPMGDDGSADLTYLLSAVKGVIEASEGKGYKVLVVKSTIPPSTTKEKIKPYIESLGKTVGKDLGLANNPEFLREGYAWDDFIHPDRIVVGSEDSKSTALLQKVYAGFEKPLHVVSYNTGEYIKYLSNTLLSTLISFANEQSMIAHSVGDINIAKAFKILHEDKRWYGQPAGMTSYVYPGCGFGGYCLPKDTNALVKLAEAKGYHSAVLENVLKVNSEIKDFHIDRITAATSSTDAIGILGLSFKPESDDVRDSPSKHIIEKLQAKGYQSIFAYDPIANAEFKKHYGLAIQYCDSMEQVLEKCKSIVILTGWKEFKSKSELLQNKQVFDLRYILM